MVAVSSKGDWRKIRLLGPVGVKSLLGKALDRVNKGD
jgi:hypothetical protein